MIPLDPSILREYDIRGVVGETLTPDTAFAIGRAFGTIVVRQGGRDVCVGYDGRLTSPGLESRLCEGLAACGLDVHRVGLGPSPMLYFAVYRVGAAAGVMVTGSHNPPEYNGFKMMLGPGVDGPAAFYGEDVQRVGALVAAQDFVDGAGATDAVEVKSAYIDHLVAEAGDCGGLSVAWDVGNGATGEVVAAMIEKLPGRHIGLFTEIDGSFPNHHPDPTVPENLDDLIDAVRREGCDLGVAFDGDGDRIGAVDRNGRIVWADQLMVAFARDILGRQPGAAIIADVKASQVLFDEIAATGGEPVMYKTGHSLIKARMKEMGAPLAGEMSGHIFFADRAPGYDDGVYAAARLLRILSEGGQSLDSLIDGLPPVVNTPELRFPCPAERKAAVVGEVKARLAAAGATVNDIDGVRVLDDDGWWLLRMSNTQDVLVARCEARSSEGLERLRAKLADQLAQSGVDLPDAG
ncbi:MAG: phosphomannomutase/phosphoglucomutase [Bauldia litoralis]